MKKNNLVLIIGAMMISLAVPSVTAGTVNPIPDVPQNYSATAFGQAGVAAGKSFGLNLSITRWTSDEEVQEFIATLKNGGPDRLVKAFEKTKDVGRFAPTGSVGAGMRMARVKPTADGGFHIVMVTNRPISWPELYNSTRSKDYQFGIVVLNVDRNGKGTGSLAPACKVRFNKQNELEIENYGQKPLRLANVRRTK